MPASSEWPHAKPKKPLHFIAQIDCAGLPPELWGGLGPRAGWLLLFADIEAIDEQKKRPIARVLHVPELGPEAEPPAGLYFARTNVFDVGAVAGAVPDAQRQHFRKWPVDLVTTAADTSALTGDELYGALAADRALFAYGNFAAERPLTWRGAYTILAQLVQGRSGAGYESNWGGLLDYPEPDANDFNRVWQELRELPEWNPDGYYRRDPELRRQMREERRSGWTQRAFKVLDEELAIDTTKLAKYRAEVPAARARGDDKALRTAEGWVEYFTEKIAQHEENRIYLKDLFGRYLGEEAFLAEIQRVGRAHLDGVKRSSVRLRELLDLVGTKDLDAPIGEGEWDAIAAELADMKSEYWMATYDTRVLKLVEMGISFPHSLEEAVREDLLDRYAASLASAAEIDPDTMARLEPMARHFECERPHKLGGHIDSVYDNPLEKSHVLLFQIASDGAVGWMWGDVGLIYVSILASDLAAGRFDTVKAWLEA